MELFSTHFMMIHNVVQPKHIMVVVQELDTSSFNLTDTILEKIKISCRQRVLRKVLRRPFDSAAFLPEVFSLHMPDCSNPNACQQRNGNLNSSRYSYVFKVNFFKLHIFSLI